MQLPAATTTEAAASSDPRTAEASPPTRISMFVPGVPNMETGRKLKSALQVIKGEPGFIIDCNIFLYQTSDTSEFHQAFSPFCNVLDTPNAAYLDHYLRVQAHKSDYVLLWAATISPTPSFRLKNLIAQLELNQLGAIGPAINFTCEGISERRESHAEIDAVSDRRWQMMPHLGSPGRLVSAVELQADIFKPSAFECFQGLISKFQAHYGSYIDILFPHACQIKVGIADKYVIKKCRASYVTYDNSVALDEGERLRDAYKAVHPGWNPKFKVFGKLLV